MMANFYQNLLEVQGLTERGFVSPIANNALLFYNYRLDGIIDEGDIIINKIEVIPKRKSDPSFVGYIYIIEDSWRIHSLNLMLTKNQIEFVDSLKVNQIYAPLDQDHWMLFTQRFSFKFKAFGIEGNGYFVGVNSNYEIEPTFSRKFFSHEIYSVQMDANQKDSIYWATIRPIPLTQTELTDYHLKDSIQVIKETKVYKDSVDSASNRITISNILFGGYVHADSYRSRFYRFDPIISAIQFNTVEGLVLPTSGRSACSKLPCCCIWICRSKHSNTTLPFPMQVHTTFNSTARIPCSSISCRSGVTGRVNTGSATASSASSS